LSVAPERAILDEGSDASAGGLPQQPRVVGSPAKKMPAAEDVSPTLLAARVERQPEVPALHLSCKHPKGDSMQVCSHSAANDMMARAATKELWCSG